MKREFYVSVIILLYLTAVYPIMLIAAFEGWILPGFGMFLLGVIFHKVLEVTNSTIDDES